MTCVLKLAKLLGESPRQAKDEFTDLQGTLKGETLKKLVTASKTTSAECERGFSAVNDTDRLKGIVHFEIKIWYLSAYPKDIQDVGVFFSSVDPILMFLGQTVLVCQSYNGRYRCPSL